MSDMTGTTATGPVGTLPAGDTAGSTPTTQNAAALNGVNADTFLNLLVSELQNQDPDNPTDPTQFLTQTAEFEEVEEMNAVQTSVSSMVTAQQSSSATSMLGMQVSGSDAAGKAVSGIVSGVQLTANGPVLSVGADSVPYSTVTSVTVPGLSGTGASTTGTGTSTTGTGTTTTGTGTTGSGTTGSGT